MTHTLAFQRYQLRFLLEDALHLNFYAGSLLRGAFGVALRKLSCMTKLPRCADCMLQRSCPYTTVFEMPPPLQHQLQAFSQIPNPYLIEPPPLGVKDYAAGEVFEFSMLLIGSAMAQLPLLIFAWQQAFAFGIGKNCSVGQLLDVSVIDANQHTQIIYQPQHSKDVQAYLPLTMPPLPAQKSLTLEFITPLHLQKHGKVLADDMTAKDFLMALVRRYYLLAEFYGQHYIPPDFAQLAELAQAIDCNSQLRWCKLHRYSNRQQQKMRFDGVLGSITLTGDLQPFLSVLQAGQWLHVGSKTTFGLGRYRIV